MLLEGDLVHRLVCIWRMAAARRGALKLAGGGVARRLRIDSDMRPPRAMPSAHFEPNHMPATYETMH